MLDHNELDHYLAVAMAAITIGAQTLSDAHGPGRITDKTDRNLVTDSDTRIQQVVLRHLSEATPGAVFLGEENTDADPTHRGLTPIAAAEFPDAELVWVLDPIDGTSNYVHGIPLHAISLALTHFGIPIVAVTHIPSLGWTYHATQGRGAFNNNQPIHARSTTDLRHAIVSISDYATGPGAERKNQRRLAITQALIPAVERIRMFGAATIDLAFVAGGLTDAAILDTNKPWDTAAGVLLAREAGASVTDLAGNPHTATGASTLAAAPHIATPLTQLTARPS
jgi:myo-inositol-1(or 4)-monophosphatase